MKKVYETEMRSVEAGLGIGSLLSFGAGVGLIGGLFGALELVSGRALGLLVFLELAAEYLFAGIGSGSSERKVNLSSPGQYEFHFYTIKKNIFGNN